VTIPRGAVLGFDHIQRTVDGALDQTPADRATIIVLARSYGADVVDIFMESRLGDHLDRNRRRAGRERVPDKAIFVTLKLLRRPQSDERFDRLYQVRLKFARRYVVEVLDDEPWASG
jgi:hypothetical protein